jgi:hypothetical protein
MEVLLFMSTCEMYSYTLQCHMLNNVPAYLTLAGFPMEVVAAAKVAWGLAAAATPIGFECWRRSVD